MSIESKIYVAGKWSDRKSIGDKINILEKMSYTITHNWTLVETPHSDRTPEMQRLFADLDVNGIKDASLLIVDMTDPNYTYRGTWTEIGIALGTGKEIWIISKNPSTNVFFHATGIIHFASWMEVFSELHM